MSTCSGIILGEWMLQTVALNGLSTSIVY